jgi:hypothetical protein
MLSISSINGVVRIMVNKIVVWEGTIGEWSHALASAKVKE